MIYEAINREILRAFILALSRQEYSESLQTQLHAISQQMQRDPALLEQPILLIQPLFDAHSNFQTAYDRACLELEQNNLTRTLDGPIKILQEASNAEITNSFKVICDDIDSIRAAQAQLNPKTSPWQKFQQLWQSSK
jgi:hypothetical protein